MKKLTYSLIVYFILSLSLAACQTSRKDALNRINTWYKQHADGYNLQLSGKAEITRYHPDQAEEKNDLMRISWKGMDITIAFKKPLSDFTWTSQSLQDNLSYYVIDDIYNDINLSGWKVYPETLSSSATHGLVFHKIENKTLRFSIDWEIYTVFGYAQSTYCQGQLQIADSSVPEDCFIGVDKRLPLHLDVEVTLP